MNPRKCVIVKLGGSLITEKDKPLTPNLGSLEAIAGEVSNAIELGLSDNLFLIHGGGSFGHYYAKKYGMSTNLTRHPEPEAISKIGLAMLELHLIVLKQFEKFGLPSRTVPPAEILDSGRPKISRSGKDLIKATWKSRVHPVSFGDILTLSNGTKIVSGDAIALALARSFPVNKVVFCMDVDGIYQDVAMKGVPIERLDAKSLVSSRLREFDVTGGIAKKIETGFELAKAGADIYFVSGRSKGRLSGILTGDESVMATRIYPETTQKRHFAKANAN